MKIRKLLETRDLSEVDFSGLTVLKMIFSKREKYP